MSARSVELRDLKATEVVGVQIDSRHRVWVCIDGQCVLRVVGAHCVEVADLRISKGETPTKSNVADAIVLLDQWMAGNSGYDEATWPVLKHALEGGNSIANEPG